MSAREQVQAFLSGCCEPDEGPKPRPIGDPRYGGFDWMLQSDEQNEDEDDRDSSQALPGGLGD